MSSNATAAGIERIAYNSCRDRNCPKCQSLARAQWLADREAELLDTQYFHVVFTVPEEIAAIAFQNKRVVYDILFRAAAETLRTIAADPAHLGAEIGFLSVLHTWGQNLLHHPHLHCLVPGGGISPDGQRWIACRPGFFLPVRVLSRLFRGLFLHYLDKAFTAGRLSFFSTLLPLQERCRVLAASGPRADGGMGGLRQAAVCRSSPGPRATSAGTRIASPSPIVACWPSTTARCASAGRIIAATIASDDDADG